MKMLLLSKEGWFWFKKIARFKDLKLVRLSLEVRERRCDLLQCSLETITARRFF